MVARQVDNARANAIVDATPTACSPTAEPVEEIIRSLGESGLVVAQARRSGTGIIRVLC